MGKSISNAAVPTIAHTITHTVHCKIISVIIVMLTKHIVNIVIMRRVSCIMHNVMQTFILVTIHCTWYYADYHGFASGQKETEEQAH